VDWKKGIYQHPIHISHHREIIFTSGVPWGHLLAPLEAARSLEDLKTSQHTLLPLEDSLTDGHQHLKL